MSKFYLVNREHSDGDRFYRKDDPREIDNQLTEKSLVRKGLVREWDEKVFGDVPETIEEAREICDAVRHERQLKLNADLSAKELIEAEERAEISRKNAVAVAEALKEQVKEDDKAVEKAKEKAEKAQKVAENKDAGKSPENKDAGKSPENKSAVTKLPGT